MTQGAPHIVLAGGGTAGHVNPLLAVAGAIRELEPAAQVTVIGTASTSMITWSRSACH